MRTLTDSTLALLPASVAVPRYDRHQLRPSVVHLGAGAFHRAHQAVYLDDLAQAGVTGWGEVGVGLRSPTIRETLGRQDGLFTVVNQELERTRVRVVGVMTDCLYAGDDPHRVVQRLADPRTRLVTMTITGDAYPVGPDGAFLPDAPEVVHDLLDPHRPATWFGYLTEALCRRRQAGLGGFTVLSCDNLAHSGAATRAAVVGFARMRDETLARWIERHVTFPDSMVDRITPGGDDALRSRVTRELGVHDAGPVSTETFTQWVVQDDFCQGRPPLEDVGVQVVDDVAPYKLVKTRILNGAHTAMAYLGWLAGHRTTDAVLADPVMRDFLAQMLRHEVAPLLPHVPQMPADDYVTTVMARLADASVADPLTRLCRRGSTKVPAYLLPSLVEAREQGRPAPLLTLALAGWFRYLAGTDLDGRPIDVVDARLDELGPRAQRGGCDPGPLLAAPGLPVGLTDDLGLRSDLRWALADLEQGGVAHAMRTRLSNGAGSRARLPRHHLRAPISAGAHA